MRERECSVWWVDTSTVELCSSASLSDAEAARAGRFRRVEDRIRYMFGALLLREVAGRRSGTDPSRVQVDRTCRQCGEAHGKPMLTGRTEGLHASISHSGSLVGLALSQLAPVGLDVESISGLDYQRLWRAVCTGGEPVPASPSAFFAQWTRKESVLKATGDGLARSMSDIALVQQGSSTQVASIAGQPISAFLLDLRPASGYAAALTVLCSAPVAVTEMHVTPTFASWLRPNP